MSTVFLLSPARHPRVQQVGRTHAQLRPGPCHHHDAATEATKAITPTTTSSMFLTPSLPPPATILRELRCGGGRPSGRPDLIAQRLRPTPTIPHRGPPAPNGADRHPDQGDKQGLSRGHVYGEGRKVRRRQTEERTNPNVYLFARSHPRTSPAHYNTSVTTALRRACAPCPPLQHYSGHDIWPIPYLLKWTQYPQKRRRKSSGAERRDDLDPKFGCCGACAGFL